MIVGVDIVVGIVSLFSFRNQMSIFGAILAPFLILFICKV